MGFRRPEVQILSPRPRRSRGCIACSDFFCKSHRALTPLRFPFPVARRKKPPCPAARGRLSCSAFSSFSFVKASREEVGGGPILSLPFPFDPLSRKRTENGPPGSSACRRDRRPERAGGRGAGQIGRGRRRTDAQRARQTGGSRRAGAQAGIRSRFPLIPSQEKELKTGGSRGRTRARAGGETGGRALAGGGAGYQRSRAEKAARLLCRMESRYRTRKIVRRHAPDNTSDRRLPALAMMTVVPSRMG